MKVALVHDYLREFGGAERVLNVLTEMYPEAPIYTAFFCNNGSCKKVFEKKDIRESFLAPILKKWNLYSPLRFLIPWLWRSFDLSDYDLIITSCSSYIARGFKVGSKTKVVAYCHTPPRYLYGYETSIDWQKYFLVKVYSVVVNHFLRLFDYKSAQEVDYWVVNSENVRQRVKKFYRREAEVIYPPVELSGLTDDILRTEKRNYFLIVSRLVGGKGLEAAAKAATELGFDLKIAGEAVGFSQIEERVKQIGGKRVELLGRVSDEEIYRLYAEAKGFIALARDEDFGMTVVEAQMAGTPVLAFNGGGFRETVVDGVTGILIEDMTVGAIKEGIVKFNKLKWDKNKIYENANRFSRENFEIKFGKLISQVMKNYA